METHCFKGLEAVSQPHVSRDHQVTYGPLSISQQHSSLQRDYSISMLSIISQVCIPHLLCLQIMEIMEILMLETIGTSVFTFEIFPTLPQTTPPFFHAETHKCEVMQNIQVCILHPPPSLHRRSTTCGFSLLDNASILFQRMRRF